MKTNLLTLGIAMILSVSGFAQQQIGNSGFESWDNVGDPEEEPTNWNSMMTGDMCGFCTFAQSQRVFQEATEVNSGNYSCRIETGSYVGNAVNGALTLGKLNAPTVTPSEGYNQSETGNTDFSEAFTSNPDSLVFWAKYEPSNNDSARVSAVIHTNYDQRDPVALDPNTNDNVVAELSKNFITGGNWIRISLPFDYSAGPQTNPEFILVTFTSTAVPGDANGIGSILYVDDVELIYNIPEVNITPATAQTILVNDPGSDLTANESPVPATSREWKYTTTSGSGYQSFALVETGATYTPQFTNAGTYYIIVESVINGNTLTSNEVEIIVIDQPEVTITPAANQNILINVDGDELTANETPAGNSREWKYSTTSGSGYQSFGTPETGMTYTPNFANAGVYYVIVESEINATTYTSNEVMVDVSEPVSTSNPTWENIKVYAYEQNVIVDLNDVNLESGDFVLYNTNGQEVMNHSLENQQTKLKVTLPVGVYFYQIIDGAQNAQGKIYIGQ